MTIEELTKQLNETKEQIAATNKRLDTVSAERDAAVAKAKLTDAEKAFADGMDEEDAAEFNGMTPEQRQAAMSKANKAKGEAEAEEIDKSKLPEAVRKHLEKTEKALEDAQKTAEQALEVANAEKEKSEKARYEARANREIPFVPGTLQKRADMLRAIDGIADKTVREDTLKALVASSNNNKQLLGEHGASGSDENTEDAGNPTVTLSKRRDEIATKEQISKAEAMKRLLDTDEGRKLYQASVAPARK